MKAVLVVLSLVFLGAILDSTALGEKITRAKNLAEASKQAQARARFERAARAICGPEAGWYEVSPGVIDCATHRGYRTQRGIAVASGE